jgi:hypothetical protein
MKISELAIACAEAANAGLRISLEMPNRRIKGWPRGELLCVNTQGRKVMSYDPVKILWALHNAGVVRIELTKDGKHART